MKLSTSLATLLAIVQVALAQSPVWGQCGGRNWNGPTTCVDGTSCVVFHEWYSQCLPNSQVTTPGTTATTTTSSSIPTSTSTVSGLHKLSVAAGKLYFGSATEINEWNDSQYLPILNNTDEFGQITPGNSMKWDATEPSRGNFQFSRGDQIANLAAANGQLVRGHTTVWHSQLPSWVSNGQWTVAELTAVVRNHVTTVVDHYRGQMYSWDVVNEPFNEDGTWRTSVFYNVLGESYIPIALEAARVADPNAKLYVNDYNFEYGGAKFTAVLNLTKKLKAAGAPLDGIGFQGHLIVGSTPGNIANLFSQLTAEGVEVSITELDIRLTLPITAEKLEQQKKDYRSVVAACKAVQGCVGVTIWDFTDKWSWIPSVFSGQGAALPWDENYNKKPAYDGIVEALQA